MDIHWVQGISRYMWIYMGFRGYPEIGGYTWVQGISRYRWIWIYIGFRRYPGIVGYGYTLGSGDIQV